MAEPGPRNLITDVPGLLVGQAQDAAGCTGTTVVLCETQAVAAVDVRGGAPGSRETELLDPAALVQRVDAIVLSGGSAFGLDAAGGVMEGLAAARAASAAHHYVSAIRRWSARSSRSTPGVRWCDRIAGGFGRPSRRLPAKSSPSRHCPQARSTRVISPPARRPLRGRTRRSRWWPPTRRSTGADAADSRSWRTTGWRRRSVRRIRRSM